MTDDDAKKAVLARRARFVAAAMTGIAAASCDTCARPCLTAAPTSVAPSAPPAACLKPMTMVVDAGEQLAIDAGGADAADGGPDAADSGDAGNDAGRDAGKKMVGPPAPPPMPCLSRPPPPRVCLSPPRDPTL